MELTADSSARLDAFLASKTSLSRSRVRKAIDMELVTINGVTELKPARRVKIADVVEIDIDSLPTEGARIEPADLSMDVLYEDDACMVVNKPAGVAVHPATGMPPGEQTVLHGIAFLFGERKIPFSTETALVHRLDKDTTGCLLIAKTAAAHTALQEQFAKRTVKKSYMAIVAGVPNPTEATIDAPVGRNLTDRRKMSVLRTSVSREARTTYRTISASESAALLQCDLHTGRTHQIRVHLSTVGHPILGDRTYASSSSGKLSEHLGVMGLCLHAAELTFRSPADDVEHTIRASLPSSWNNVFDAAGVHPQST